MDLKLSGQLPAGQGDSTFFGALAAALAAGACAGWVARGGSCDRGSGDSGGRDSSGSNGSSSGSEVCTAAVHFNTFPYNTAVQYYDIMTSAMCPQAASAETVGRAELAQKVPSLFTVRSPPVPAALRSSCHRHDGCNGAESRCGSKAFSFGTSAGGRATETGVGSDLLQGCRSRQARDERQTCGREDQVSMVLSLSLSLCVCVCVSVCLSVCLWLAMD